MSEVVGQFSTSKWKPVEKSDSNNSSEPVKKESSDLSHVRMHSLFFHQSLSFNLGNGYGNGRIEK